VAEGEEIRRYGGRGSRGRGEAKRDPSSSRHRSQERERRDSLGMTIVGKSDIPTRKSDVWGTRAALESASVLHARFAWSGGGHQRCEFSQTQVRRLGHPHSTKIAARCRIP
jgi:hypothetical protein